VFDAASHGMPATNVFVLKNYELNRTVLLATGTGSR
jgi:hypothetical protein